MFRATFGLAPFASGSLTVVHPGCADPGVPRGASAGDDGEATYDAEWASAAAPDASILVAACHSTRTTFGGLLALENFISSANPPSVISISYGSCEAENGEAGNAAFAAAYQQAVAEGISIFVSAGDEGAAACDAGAAAATHGIGVSGWASTPYNVAVGGTDFTDSYNNTNGTYWIDEQSRLRFGAILRSRNTLERFLCRQSAGRQFRILHALRRKRLLRQSGRQPERAAGGCRRQRRA